MYVYIARILRLSTLYMPYTVRCRSRSGVSGEKTRILPSVRLANPNLSECSRSNGKKLQPNPSSRLPTSWKRNSLRSPVPLFTPTYIPRDTCRPPSLFRDKCTRKRDRERDTHTWKIPLGVPWVSQGDATRTRVSARGWTKEEEQINASKETRSLANILRLEIVSRTE